MRTWLVKKREEIVYAKEYTDAQLIEMGVEPEILTEDGDTRVDLETELNHNDAVREAIEQDIERHGDVQGGQFGCEVVQEGRT